jgi:uncharacterized surface protein with fasciclin (FAS1) repeats
MKIGGLIISAILGSVASTLHAQDAAPPSVDLYSGQKPPEVTSTPPPVPTGPDVPELSQLDAAFKQSSLGKTADERRVHIEWRRLKNQVANDPSVRAAEAATHTAHTDLEKRKRLRDYYNVYYERMSALASSAEIKLALQSLKDHHIGSTKQPRVRHLTDGTQNTPTPTPSPTRSAMKAANLNRLNADNLPPEELPSPSASPTATPLAVANLSAVKPVNQPPPTLPSRASSPSPGAERLAVIGQSAGHLNTFLKALATVQKAVLSEDNSPITLFAPTDRAFAKLPPGMLENLLKPENKGKLTGLLAYHIMKGVVTSGELTTKAPTLLGPSLDIKIADAKITVNDAHVIKADVKVPNGVIHVIDKVLIPPNQ